MKTTSTTLLLAAVCALAPFSAGAAATHRETVRFPSVTPENRYQLAHHSYPAAATEIWGTLSLPAKGDGPFPAIVIAHGSAGVQPKDQDRWVPLLNGMGIATLAVDSFAPRGIRRTDEEQAQLDQAANDADAFAALKHLAADPRIDRHRIGILGFSRGGIAALETAVESFRQGVVDGDLRFAAHIAFYPGCGLRYWRNPSPLTGAPIMMALAEKDDYVPAQACVSYADAMRAAGQDVEVHVYADALHDFDNTVSYRRRGTRVETSKHCPDREIDPVTWRYKLLATGQTFTDYRQFARRLDNCVTRGDVTTGSNERAAREAERDVRAFLRRVFRLPD